MARTLLCSECLEIWPIVTPLLLREGCHCSCGGLLVIPEKAVYPKDHYAAVNKAILVKVSSGLPLENMH